MTKMSILDYGIYRRIRAQKPNMNRQRTMVNPLPKMGIFMLSRGADLFSGIAFWTAFALRMFYLPMLSNGLSPESITEIAQLFNLHADGLVLDHDYSGG